jgi:hypothetical protein
MLGVKKGFIGMKQKSNKKVAKFSTFVHFFCVLLST